MASTVDERRFVDLIPREKGSPVRKGWKKLAVYLLEFRRF